MVRTLFLLLLSSGSVVAQVNINQGLMAYYPFSGNANDVSGNNNNPVFNNATLTADRFGNPNSAYSFNGTSNYMRIPNSATLNYTTQMSITAWVKVAGFYQGPCHGNRIVMKGDADGLTGNYTLCYDDNGFTNGQNCVNPVPDIQHQNFYGVNTPPPAGGYTPFIQTNQWYMVTVTSDGTTAKFYVNCDLKITAPASGATFTNGFDLFLGKMNAAQFPYWFNGVMDEVRIYNRALTTDEVNFLGGCNTATACVPTFQKLYGGNKNDIAWSVASNPDGTYVITGSTLSFGSGNNDGYLQKMDKDGNILWSKTFGGTGNDNLVSVKPTTDGGYIAAGSTTSFGGSSNGVAWMVKTDGNGNMQWSRKYDEGHVSGSRIVSAIPTSDGGYAMAGISQFAPGTANAMVIKTDNNGVVQWAKSFNSLNSDEASGVIEDANSLIVVANQYGQSSSFYDVVIMKLNTSDGSVVWARNYDIESQSSWAGRLFKTATGYSFDVAEGPNFNPTAPEQVVINTDLNGNPLFVRKVASTPLRFGNYTPTSDGGYITVQSYAADPNDDIHMVKVSASGVIQWTRRFGGTGTQNANDIIPSPDGGYLIAGINNGTPSVSDSSDIIVIKTDSLGNAPNCNPGTTVATVTNPTFTINASFVWASVTNLSFAPTAITPVSANPNPFTNTLCSSTCNVGSGCNPTFQKLYGGNKNDIAWSVTDNPDGTYVITGSTQSFGSGNNDGYLQKMDKDGNILWSKTFGGTGNDFFLSVKPTADGGYITAGSTASFGGSSNGVAWLVKTDGNGNLQWSRKYDDGNVNGSLLWDVINTADGGYALSGTNRYASGTANGMMIKTDNTGAVVWAKSFDSNNSDGTMASLEDANSLIVISYQYGQSSSFYDAVIMKLNISDGSVAWARNYDIESKLNWPRELFKTQTGYSFSCFEDVSFSVTTPELAIVNTDLNGNPLSLRKVTGSPSRYGYYLPTNDGGFITTQGALIDPNDDMHLVKVTAAGAVQWTRKFGGTGLQQIYDMAKSPDGGYFMAGINNGTPSVSDSSNIIVFKTDSLGNAPTCNTGTTAATVTNPTFTVNASFVWTSVTNLSFSPTAITPVSANPNPFTTTLCSSTCVGDTIINNYTPVLSLDKCKNTLTVEDGTAFNTGDTVLMIQMKGAVIDSTNTATFGTITDYKNAGNYEFNYVKSKTGNIIELKNTITRQYDLPGGKVQLIRVPYYQKANFTSTLTCLPWDGSKGGVLVLNVQDSVILNANIDVSGKGFRGGVDPFSSPPVFNCNENQFYYPVNPDLASGKGEGIAEVSASRSFGKGALANGGGSGNSHNSGGGGGSNAAVGGFGGYNFEGSPCTNAPFDNRGIGGKLLTYSNAANKIFLGGGGGAGHTNNPEAFQATGGKGSGIVIIMADKLKSNGFQVFANGSAGATCGNTSSGCHEGMGGGGAGGTVLLKINNYIDASLFQIQGGTGASMTASGFLKVGPGGGGGGGKLWLTNPSLPVGASVTVSAGQNGVCTAYANDPWGATPGQVGSTLFNLIIPVDIIPFRPNIDSVRIKDSMTACKAFDFKGFGYTNTNPIALWQWNFGDAGTSAIQNPSHLYASAGTYIVKLIVTDINGCKDSITKAVTAIQFTADAGNDTTICSAASVSVTLHASAGSSYSWTPAVFLNNPTLQNPTATISTTTRFYVTITSSPATPNCTATDSVLITLSTAPANMRYPTVTAQVNQPFQLQARNLGGNSYIWQPAVGLNNPLIINPVFSYNQTQEYRIFISTSQDCQVVDTQLVKINGKKGIYVPRAFSPNGDGINDRLYPILIGIQQLYYFKVYNRWGNLIFETTSGNPATGWDGKYKGSLQPVETYAWVAQGIDVDGIVIKKSGNTFLLR